MGKFIPPEKMSKKARKKLHAGRRRTWGMSPVTRTVPNGKAYDRKKRKNEERKNGTGFSA